MRERCTLEHNHRYQTHVPEFKKRTREEIREANFSRWKSNLNTDSGFKARPNSLEILYKVYRLRHKHPITVAFLMRKFQISYTEACKIKAKVDIRNAKDPVWYPGKPAEESKEDLDTFLKRITLKRTVVK